MLTEKDRQILIQVAFKGAIDIVARNGEFQAAMAGDEAERAGALGWLNSLCVEVENVLFSRIATITTPAPEQAMPTLQAAFPGSVVEQQTAPQAPQQFYAPQPTMPAAPPPQQFMPPTFTPPMAPAPQQYQQAPTQQYQGNGGGSRSDADWQDLLMNPNQWRDERFNKRNPNGPDFVHAFRKGANGKDVGLWLHGKFGQPPQHILQQLQIQGRA